MKWIARIAIGIAAVAVVLLGAAYLMPRQVSVSRSVAIAAPPEAVFPHLDNLQAFHRWSPWTDLDPDMAVRFSGPERGPGNRMEWESADPSVGSGAQEILVLDEGRRVVTAVDFGDMGQATAEWQLTPTGAGTVVVWSFETDLGLNPAARWMGPMMDGWVGADYERGLARLKAAVEGG